MRSAILAATALAVVSGTAHAADDLLKRSRDLFAPLPGVGSEAKGADPALVDLGKSLYFEPRLSASGLISCNTCHNVGAGGVDGMETSVGHGWAKGPRNAPTVLNATFNTSQFWDGRAPNLKEQAKGPVQAGVEMNNSPDRVEATLKSIPGYVSQFAKAFPKAKDTVTFDNMATAIAAFEATLVTPDAPFDRYLKGDAKALTAQQKKGLATFVDSGCASCHSGVNLGGNSFQKFGVAKAPPESARPEGDKGREKVTSNSDDAFAFRVPTLRNTALTAPYFHTGKVRSLEEAVRVMGESQLGRTFSDAETADIVAFLGSLTGKQPQVTLPILPASSATTPAPVL